MMQAHLVSSQRMQAPLVFVGRAEVYAVLVSLPLCGSGTQVCNLHDETVRQERG